MPRTREQLEREIELLEERLGEHVGKCPACQEQKACLQAQQIDAVVEELDSELAELPEVKAENEELRRQLLDELAGDFDGDEEESELDK